MKIIYELQKVMSTLISNFFLFFFEATAITFCGEPR